jgi:hypothetical protein
MIDLGQRVKRCRAFIRMIAKDFLNNLTQAVPYKIHTVLTDKAVAECRLAEATCTNDNEFF